MASFRAISRDAIRYWEPRRLVYNGVLAIIVVAAFIVQWPRSKEWLGHPALPFFAQALLGANLLYCLAYLAECVAQVSPFCEAWRKWRVVLFVLGVVCASALALFVIAI